MLIYPELSVGANATWTYEDKSADNFCEYTPFKFAFVLLIIWWIFIPILLCCELVLCCGCLFLYALAPKDNPV